MTRSQTLALVAALACAAAPSLTQAAKAAPVATDAVRRAFGNTIVSTYPDGRKGYLWLKADGSFRTMGRHRTYSTGTWSVKSAKVCLKRVHPPAPFGYCTAAPSGDQWKAKAVTGEEITVSLVKGIVDH